MSGNADAQYFLGNYYSGDESLDLEEAVTWYIRAAKNGNVDAQFLLGCCYYEGTIVQCDFKMALKWWNCAAKQDHNNAIGILSFCKNNISICDESWKIKSTRYFSKEELKRIKKAVLVSTSQGVLIKFYLYDGIITDALILK